MKELIISDTADACRTNCLVFSCGDGILDTGEDCDNGSSNSDITTGACRTNCNFASCGDGICDINEDSSTCFDCSKNIIRIWTFMLYS